MRILKYLALILSLTTAATAQVPNHETVGIGVELRVKEHNFVVLGILPNSPAAAQNDIHVGDRILAVAQGDEPAVQVQFGKLAQAVALIRGPKGTTVRLTIVPAGKDDSEAQIVSFVRGELKELKTQDVESMGAAVPTRPRPASRHWLVVVAVAIAVALAGASLFLLFRRKSE